MFFLELLCHGLILELDNELNIVVGASDVNSSLEGLTPIPHYCHNSQCQQSNFGTRVASGALLVGKKSCSAVYIFKGFFSFLVAYIIVIFYTFSPSCSLFHTLDNQSLYITVVSPSPYGQFGPIWWRKKKFV